MSLEALWFFIWGLLWAVFFMTDGFDFGVGSLYPFLGKNDQDRRIMINTLGPLWDGNEVWLITAGGVTFAAFPLVYATMFSSLYSILMLILFALIVRGVSFEFRGKIDHPAWTRIWDACVFVGSLVPALLFGVVFANIFQGLPFDDNGYYGSLVSLFNPYGLLGGFLFLALFLQHGAVWLCLKTEGELRQRAETAANDIWYVLLCLIVVFLIVSAPATNLYDNYWEQPILLAVIPAAVAALLGVKIFLKKGNWAGAWFCSGLTIGLGVFFGLIGLFPSLLPSSLGEQYHLTAYNAASSPLTLKIMLGVVVVVIPVVIAYQTWAYLLFRGKVTAEDLEY
ncbi:MAG: cytochrome d ubiquinol oxidase subunit II [Desulfosudaceae bacterium]